MSIQCLKQKGVIQYGSNRSGKPPGGIWVSQGPFGPSGVDYPYGPVGFSIQGGHRNVGYIGQSMRMSKNGTPFWGVYARGYGGTNGKYKRVEPSFNVSKSYSEVLGNQYKYIKQSVLSNGMMLNKKYKWIKNGTYPNYWVQPVYGNSNLSDNASQWLYVQNKAAANICVNGTNDYRVYEGYRCKCDKGCVGGVKNVTKNTYNDIAANAPYTKQLGIPQTSGQYTLQVQRPCANPVGPQKPFPFAVNGGTRSSVHSTPGRPNPILTVNYVTPPDWYTQS
jgi:hypothetical protein